MPTVDGVVQILSGSGLLYPVYIVLAVLLAYVFYAIFNTVLILSNFVGTYQKPITILERGIYRFKMIGCYLALSFPIYLAVLSIIQVSSPKLLDYILMFPVMLSILIAFRILAIPTKFTYKLFALKDFRKPLIIEKIDEERILNINEQSTSLFFGFIALGIIVIIINFIFEEGRERLYSNISGLLNLPEIFTIFLAYLLALGVSAIVTELFLDYTHVIQVEKRSYSYYYDE